jgi:hypothetical protein
MNFVELQVLQLLHLKFRFDDLTMMLLILRQKEKDKESKIEN